MPTDFFYPWKWPRSALQSHVTVSTSRTFLKPRCNLTNTNFAFPAALTPAPLVWLGPSSPRLEPVCYLSSSENVHIQVKLFAVEKAGGMSHTKDLWSTFSGCAVLETEKIPWGDFTLAGKDSRNLKRYFLLHQRTMPDFIYMRWPVYRKQLMSNFLCISKKCHPLFSIFYMSLPVFKSKHTYIIGKLFFYLQKKNGYGHGTLTCWGNVNATWCLDHNLLKQQ